MAPLQSASVMDLYGTQFGMNPEQIVQQTLKNNQLYSEKNSEYQKNLKENEISGKANFQEYLPKSTFGNLNGNNTNIPPFVKQNNNLRNTNFGPDPAPISINKTEFARRPAFTDINNNFPENQNLSMFNRFQNLLGNRENFGSQLSDSECLQNLVYIANEIQLILKIIMFVIILLFMIKILEKKN